MPLVDKKDWFQAIANKNHSAIRTAIPRFAGSTNGAGDTGLIMAARLNDVELAHLLAKQEATLTNPDNLTALMIAAQSDHPRVVEVLAPLEYSIFLPNGRTALSLAAEAGHDECVMILVKYLSTERDCDSLSALDYAVKNDNLNCIKIMLNTHKFTIDDITHTLRYAHEKDAVDTVKVLEAEAERIANLCYAQATASQAVVTSIEQRSPGSMLGSRVGGPRSVQGATNGTSSMRSVGMTESMRSGGRVVTRFSDLATYEKELDMALTKLDRYEVDRTVLKTENTRLFEENTKLKAEIKLQQEQLDKIRVLVQCDSHNVEEIASTCKHFINDLQVEKARRSKEYEELKQDVSILKAKNQAFKVDLNTLMSTKIEHEKAAQYLKQNIVSKDEVLNALQDQNREVIEQAKMLEHKSQDLEIEIAKLSDNVARQKNEAIGLRSIIDLKDKEIEDVKAQVEEINEVVSTYRQRTLAAEDEKNEILNEVARRKAAYNALESKKEELENQVIGLADELTKSSVALQALQNGISNLEDPFAIAATGDFINYADDDETSIARKILTGDKAAMLRHIAENEIASYGKANEEAIRKASGYVSKSEIEWLTDPVMQQIRQAILKGDYDLAIELTKKVQLDFTNLRNETGPKTYLMSAAEHGEILKVWFYRPYQAGKQDNHGKTALMYAAENGHAECVRLLLDSEAGITLENGWTALMAAVLNNHTDCVQILETREGGLSTNDLHEEGAGFTALMLAAKLGHTECARFLMDKEAPIKHSTGRRAIFYAKSPEIKNLLSLFN